jgi:hypothetical protein
VAAVLATISSKHCRIHCSSARFFKLSNHIFFHYSIYSALTNRLNNGSKHDGGDVSGSESDEDTVIDVGSDYGGGGDNMKVNGGMFTGLLRDLNGGNKVAPRGFGIDDDTSTIRSFGMASRQSGRFSEIATPLPGSYDDAYGGDPNYIPSPQSTPMYHGMDFPGGGADGGMDAAAALMGGPLGGGGEGGGGDPGAGMGLKGALADKFKGAMKKQLMTQEVAHAAEARTKHKGEFMHPYDNSIDPTEAIHDYYFGDVEHMWKMPMYEGIALKVYLSICITCYNEDWTEMRDTLTGVSDNVDNIPMFNKKNKGMRPLHPKEVLTVTVFDGRTKTDKSLFEERADGAHFMKEHDWDKMDGVMKIDEERQEKWEKEKKEREAAGEKVEDDEAPAEVAVHLLTRFDLRLKKGSRGNTVWTDPFDVIFCIKEENGGKLNSHLWMFHGICPVLEPEYCYLLDAGTKMMPKSMLMLYRAMENNTQIGGCCGEICVDFVPCTNLVIASQHFEYKTSHVMMKAMESVFGFISVLPGAFSAYRFKAIRGMPLDKYFFLETFENKAACSPFVANMYLAEDRKYRV